MSAGPRWGGAEFPDVAIRTDAEGRYFLNDLHRAAGGNAAHAPAQWMRYDNFKALVAELETVGKSTVSPVDSKTGRNGGTYVCRGAQEIR